MAQTPVIVNSVVGAPTIEYRATGDKTAGDVVAVGDVVCVVKRDIDYSEDPLGTVTDGRGDVDWLMPQDASIKTAGDALYWNSAGDPVGGTAGSGAATTTANAYLIGWVAPSQPNGTNATAATDSYVRAIPNACRRTATIAGSVTAADITGSDADLGIAGKAGSASAGGAVTCVGGAGAGAGNAGGAFGITGGAGVAAAGATGGVGGAVPRTGGAGGADTSAGTGGAGGAAINTGGAGGAVTGAGTGGAGGAAQNVGGAGGATSTTGTGGVGGSISGTGGAGGNATGAGTGGAGGAAVDTAGAGGTAATTGTGGAGGAAGKTAGAGGAAGAGGTGGAGGAANLTAGVGGAAATNGTGGAAGAVDILGAAGGATATGTGGAGSTITITAGNGGTASGAGTSGAGGSIVVTPGSSAAGGGTAGKQGRTALMGVVSFAQGTPTAETTAATIDIADLLTGIITGTHNAGATQAYTLDTGTAMSAGCSLGIGESFDWVLINLSAAAADTITVTAAADHTIVGNPIVQSAHATTGGVYGNSAMFRSRKTGATTWVTYRIA